MTLLVEKPLRLVYSQSSSINILVRNSYHYCAVLVSMFSRLLYFPFFFFLLLMSLMRDNIHLSLPPHPAFPVPPSTPKNTYIPICRESGLAFLPSPPPFIRVLLLWYCTYTRRHKLPIMVLESAVSRLYLFISTLTRRERGFQPSTPQTTAFGQPCAFPFS